MYGIYQTHDNGKEQRIGQREMREKRAFFYRKLSIVSFLWLSYSRQFVCQNNLIYRK